MKLKKIIIVFIVLILFSGCSHKTKVSKEPEITKIRDISKLSTLKVYYNNVASYEKEKDFFLQKDRKMFIEYQGIAKIGVDMSKITMKIDGNIVTISLPKAELLNEPEIEEIPDENFYFSKDNLIFKNKITTSEKQLAIEESKKNMKDSIEKNDELLLLAQSRAKKLIENYINQLGEISEKKYQIVWINS